MTKIKSRRNYRVAQKKGTLDQKHMEQISKFDRMASSLPAKKEKLKRLQSELKELGQMTPSKKSREDIRRNALLIDSVNKLRGEINSIENCTDSLNYIVNTLPILVDYYDNKEVIDDEEHIEPIQENGKRNILSYFIKEANLKTPINGGSGGSKCSKQNPPLNRARLYDTYLSVTDINYNPNKKVNSSICGIVDCDGEKCDGEKILIHNDGSLVCKKCGASESILITTDKPSFKEPTQDSGIYAYKRINHLTEILSQLQAKESTDIPSKIFESIRRELKKRKIDKNDLDIFKLRRILKKLNYRKYYEHVPHILQIINGKEPPNFGRNDEIKIKKMFRDIQKPFSIYCPKNRKNFLNYSYVLHKFCELLDLDDYINYFPLLKNNAKLLQHDRIWMNICKYMKWEYYKSI